MRRWMWWIQPRSHSPARVERTHSISDFDSYLHDGGRSRVCPKMFALACSGHEKTQPTNLDPGLAARMERLAARRARSSTTTAATEPAATTASDTQAPNELDPDLAARMERLASRRSTTAATPESTVGVTVAPANKPKKKRSHPAKGSRVASLVLSLATTIGLTGFMAADCPPVQGAANPGIVPSGGTTAQSPGTSAQQTSTMPPPRHRRRLTPNRSRLLSLSQPATRW